VPRTYIQKTTTYRVGCNSCGWLHLAAPLSQAKKVETRHKEETCPSLIPAGAHLSSHCKHNLHTNCYDEACECNCQAHNIRFGVPQ